MSRANTKAAETFLTDQLQNFYYEILRQKELCLRYSRFASIQRKQKPHKKDDPENAPQKDGAHQGEGEEKQSKESGDTTQAKEDTLPQEFEEEKLVSPLELMNNVQERLRIVLMQQYQDMMISASPVLRDHYSQAQYIMVALADEVFLNFQWDGRQLWEDNLLESYIFQTQVAGELFFKRLDELLERNDPLMKDLATLYLLCIGLGFRGKYATTGGIEKLHWYRHQLYEMIYQQNSRLYTHKYPYLIKDCYDHILSDTIKKDLPEVRLWGYIFLGVLVTYLFVTYSLWYHLTAPLDSLSSLIQMQPISFGGT